MFKFTVLVAILMSFFTASAFACKCFPNFESKKYQKIEDKFYGKKFSYSCKYECKSRGYKEKVIGSHKKTVIGGEKGNEIVCDGTIYKEQYSVHKGWFIYLYEGSEWFDAKKSSSKEIKDWAERNCI